MPVIHQSTFVSFRSGTYHFCLPHTSVEEVLPISSLERPPGCPEILDGMLVLSGRMRPVVNLSTLLGLTAEVVSQYTPMLLLKGTTVGLVLTVDAVLDVFEADRSRFSALAAEDSLNGCCSALYQLDEQLYYQLDLKNLLTKKETLALTAYHERLAQREKRFQSG